MAWKQSYGVLKTILGAIIYILAVIIIGLAFAITLAALVVIFVFNAITALFRLIFRRPRKKAAKIERSNETRDLAKEVASFVQPHIQRVDEPERQGFLSLILVAAALNVLFFVMLFVPLFEQASGVSWIANVSVLSVAILTYWQFWAITIGIVAIGTIAFFAWRQSNTDLQAYLSFMLSALAVIYLIVFGVVFILIASGFFRPIMFVRQKAEAGRERLERVRGRKAGVAYAVTDN